MASFRKLVLVAGLAFLVLASQNHGHGEPAGGGLAIGAAAVITAQPPLTPKLITPQPPLTPELITPQTPLTPELAQNKRGPIPKSGPSDKWNYEVNHEKPSPSAESGGRRRSRAVVGRRLGSA